MERPSLWAQQLETWHLVEWPLRPSREDLVRYRQWSGGGGVLLLGASTFGLSNAYEQRSIVVDREQAMLDAFQAQTVGAAAPWKHVQMDWLGPVGLPSSRTDAVNAVVGDGVINLARNAAAVSKTLQTVREVLNLNGGDFHTRIFHMPEGPHHLPQHAMVVDNGDTYSTWKLRLMMACARNRAVFEEGGWHEGVYSCKVGEIWETYERARLAGFSLPWEGAERNLQAYEDRDERLCFPTLRWWMKRLNALRDRWDVVECYVKSHALYGQVGHYCLRPNNEP